MVTISPTAAIASRLDALRAGADEALADTIDPTELGARIAFLEERSRPRPATLLTVTDDTELDLAAHEVRRAGSLVHLRPKEFQLLTVLASHRARRTPAGSSSIVCRARRTTAIRARSTSTSAGCAARSGHGPRRRPHLVTVRGVGYRLDPDGR